VASARWIGYLIRLAALAAAVLIGPDGADAQLAGESGVDAAALFALSSLPSAANETSERSDSNLDPERSSNVRRALAAQVRPETFPGGSLSGLFNRGGLLGGFAAGFLGCGLFGMLFGRGLLGGLGGAPSYLGLLVQLALVATLCWLIWTRWRDADAADLAALSPRQLADPYLRSRDDLRARVDAPPDQAHGPDPHDQSSLPHSTEVTDTSGKCE
jgi:predicted lipid-binding transport protein (Tim44 family)